MDVVQLRGGQRHHAQGPDTAAKVTVPPAADPEFRTQSVSGDPKSMDTGDADSVNDGVAGTTVKLAPFAIVLM